MRFSAICCVLTVLTGLPGCFPDSEQGIRVGLGIGLEGGGGPSDDEVQDYLDFRLAQTQQELADTKFVLGVDGNFFFDLKYFCMDGLVASEVVADTVKKKTTGELDYIELEAIVEPCDQGRFGATAYHLLYGQDQQRVDAYNGIMSTYTRIPPDDPNEQMVVTASLLDTGSAGCKFVAATGGNYTFAVMDADEGVVLPPEPMVTLKQGEQLLLDFSGLPFYRNLKVVYMNDYPGAPGGTWNEASGIFLLDDYVSSMPDVCNM